MLNLPVVHGPTNLHSQIPGTSIMQKEQAGFFQVTGLVESRNYVLHRLGVDLDLREHVLVISLGGTLVHIL